MWLKCGIIFIFALIASNVADDQIPVFKQIFYTAKANKEYDLESIPIDMKEPVEENLKFEIIDSVQRDYFKWDKNDLSSGKSLGELFVTSGYITVEIKAYYDGKPEDSAKTVLIINGPDDDEEQPIPVFKEPLYTANTNAEYNLGSTPIVMIDPLEENLKFEIIDSDQQEYFKWDKNKLSSEKSLEELFGTSSYITVKIQAYYDGKPEASAKTVLIINGPDDDEEQPIPVFKELLYTANTNAEYNLGSTPIVMIDPLEENLKFEIIDSDQQEYFKWDKNKLSSEKSLEELFGTSSYITVKIQAYYDGKPEASAKTVLIINGPDDDEEQPIPVFKEPLYTAKTNAEYNLGSTPIVMIDPLEENLKFEIIDSDQQEYFKWDKNKLSSEKSLEELFGTSSYITVKIQAYYDGKPEASAKTVLIINGPDDDEEQPIPVFKELLYTANTNAEYNLGSTPIVMIDPLEENLKFEIIDSDQQEYFKWDKNKLSSEKSLKELFGTSSYITVKIQAYYDGKPEASAKTVLIINGPDDDEEQPIPVFKEPLYTAKTNAEYNLGSTPIVMIDPLEENLKFEIIDSDQQEYFKWDKNKLSSEKSLEELFGTSSYITVKIQAYYDGKPEASAKTVLIINGPDDDEEQPIPVFKELLYTANTNAEYNLGSTPIVMIDPLEENLKFEIIDSDQQEYFKWDKNKLSSEKSLKELFGTSSYITVKIQAYYDGKPEASAKTVLIINGPDDDEEQPIPVFKEPLYTAKTNAEYNLGSTPIVMIDPLEENLKFEIIDSDQQEYFKWDKNKLSSEKSLEELFGTSSYITVKIQAYYDGKPEASAKTVLIINGPDDDEEQPIPVFKEPLYTAKTNAEYNLGSTPIVMIDPLEENLKFEIIDSDQQEYFKWDKNKLSSEKSLEELFGTSSYITVKIQAYYDGKPEASAKTVLIINGPDDDEEQPIPVFKEPLYTAKTNAEYNLGSTPIVMIDPLEENLKFEIIDSDQQEYFKWDKNKLSSEKSLEELFGTSSYITVKIQAYYDGKPEASAKTVLIINGPDDDEEQPIPVFKELLYTANTNAEYNLGSTPIVMIDPLEENLKFEIIDSDQQEYFKWDKNKLSSEKSLKELFGTSSYITVKIQAYYDGKPEASAKTVLIINGPDDDEEQPIPVFKEPLYTAKTNAEYNLGSTPIVMIDPLEENLKFEIIDSDQQEYFKWDKNKLSSEKSLEELFGTSSYITVKIQAYYDGKPEASAKTVLIINGPDDDEEQPIPVFKELLYTANTNAEYNLGSTPIVMIDPLEENLKFEIIDSDQQEYFKWDKNKLSSEKSLKELFGTSSYITVKIQAYYDGKPEASAKTVLIINGPDDDEEQPIPVFKEPLYTAKTNAEYNLGSTPIVMIDPLEENLKFEIIDSDQQEYFKWDKNKLSSEKSLEELFGTSSYITVKIQAYYDGKPEASAKTVLIINGPDDDEEQPIPVFKEPLYTAKTNAEYNLGSTPIVMIDPLEENLKFEIIDSDQQEYFKWDKNKLSSEKSLEELFGTSSYITVKIQAYYDGKPEASAKTVLIINGPDDDEEQPIPVFKEPLYTAKTNAEYNLGSTPIVMIDPLEENLKFEIIDSDQQEYFKWDKNKLSSEKSLEELFGTSSYITVKIQAYYDGKPEASAKTVLIINGPDDDEEQPIPVFKELLYTANTNAEYNLGSTPIVMIDPLEENLKFEIIDSDQQEYFKWDKNKLSSEKSLEELFGTSSYITVKIQAYYDGKPEASAKTVLIINGPDDDEEQPIPVFKEPLYTAKTNAEYNLGSTPIVMIDPLEENLKFEIIDSDQQEYFKWDKNKLSSEKSLEELFGTSSYITVKIQAYYDGKPEASAKTVLIINGPDDDEEQPIPVFKEPLYTAKTNAEYNLGSTPIVMIDPLEENLKFEIIDSDQQEYFKWDKNKLSSEKSLEELFGTSSYITVKIQAYYDGKPEASAKTVLIINGPDDDEEQPIPVFKEPLYTAKTNAEYNLGSTPIVMIDPLEENLKFEIIDSDQQEYFKWDKNKLSSEKSLEELFGTSSYITVKIQAYYDGKPEASAKTVLIINGPDDDEEQPIPVFKELLYTANTNAEYNLGSTPIVMIDPLEENLKFEIIDSDQQEYFKWDKNKLSSEKSLKELFGTSSYITVKIQAYYDGKPEASAKTVLIINGPDDDEEQPIPVFKELLYTANTNAEYNLGSTPIVMIDPLEENLKFEIIDSDQQEYFKWDKNKLSSEKSLKELFGTSSYITVKIQAYYDGKPEASAKTVLIINGPDDDEEQPIPVFKEPLYTAKTNAEYNLGSTPIVMIDPLEENLKFEIIDSDQQEYFKWDKNKLSSEKSLEELFGTSSYITVKIQAYYDGKPEASAKTVLIINGPDDDEEQPIPVFKELLYTANTNAEYNLGSTPIVMIDPLEENLKFEIIDSDQQEYFKWDKNKLSSEKSLKELFGTSSYITVKIQAYYDGKPEASAKTVLIINGPDDDEEQPIPVFKELLYTANTNAEYNLGSTPIVMIDPLEENLKFEIIDSDQREYFKWDKNKLSSEKSLEELFGTSSYITVKIQAYYDGKPEASAKTVLIINGPDDDEEQPIPVFKELLYTANTNAEYNLGSTPIVMIDPLEENLKFEIIDSDQQEYFKWDKNKLSSEKSLKELFGTSSYITVKIQAYYDGKPEASAKTVLIINGPDDDEEQKDQIPVFKEPLYTANANAEYNLDSTPIAMKDTVEENVIFEIIDPDQRDYFKWDKNNLSSEKSLKELFKTSRYITVKIQAYYDGKPEASAKTVVIINAPENEEETKISYQKKLIILDKDNTFTGLIGTFTAETNSKEIILYDIVETEPNIKDKLEYKVNGELIVKETLLDVPYFQITLRARGKDSLIEDTMDVILVINKRINEDGKFEYSLVVEHVPENSKQTIIVSASSKVQYEIVEEDSNEWFKIDEGHLFLRENIDREDSKLKDMLQSQVKTSIKAVNKSPLKSSNISMNKLYETSPKAESNKQTSCIDIPSIPYSRDIMHVVVTIEDKNDNSPKFVENDPLIIGYPSPDLAKSVAPPYIVKVTATDEDIGINAKIRYSVNNIFKIDAENGIIYPGDKLSEDTEFKVTATDRDGADDGNKTPLTVKVKILQEEHITVITVKDKAYSELDAFIEELGKEINKIVKYLTITALPKTESAEKEKSLRETRADDGIIPVLKIVMYAFNIDNDKVVAATDLKKLIEESELAKLIDVKLYVAPNEPLAFDKPVYEAQYTENDEMDSILIKLITSSSTAKPTVKIEDEYKSYFKWENNMFALKKPLPENIFDDADYITVTIEAYYHQEKGSVKAVVIINAPENDNGNAEFEYSLVVDHVPENSKQKQIVPASSNVQYEIVEEDSKEWFKIDKGHLFLRENIDRENYKLKDMLQSQVKTTIRAVNKSPLKSSNISMNKLYETSPKAESNKQTSCIDIPSIRYNSDRMHVVVTIEDENDNAPKFVEEGPLTIGYPSPDLAKSVAPPYIVKVTATDEDIGINAKIRYSVNNNFKIDAENGIIYPGDKLSEDTEFTVTATDRDGAEDGNKTSLTVKVKILEEEHITVITVKDMAYSELDAFIAKLGNETKTNVKYLTSTALPKTESTGKEKSLRETRADDDKIPVLKIVMYASSVADDKVVESSEFKTMIEKTDLAETVEVKEYEAPVESLDESGWVAAVSTISVLLALVLIGGLVGYLFYIRPRLTSGASRKYADHTYSESGHTSMTPDDTFSYTDTNVSARQPRGYLDDRPAQSRSDWGTPQRGPGRRGPPPNQRTWQRY